jgi:hypothetical protein
MAVAIVLSIVDFIIIKSVTEAKVIKLDKSNK